MLPRLVWPESVLRADGRADSERKEIRAAITPSIPPPILLALLVVPAILLFASAMTLHLDHDEHQFVAAGQLLAHDGLLPYADFPYFHTPYLVAIDAAMFRLTDHALLAARLLSAGCASATIALIGWIALRCFADQSESRRVWAAGSIVALLLCNPVILFTAGRAWNHDLAILLMLCQFCCIAFPTKRYARFCVLAGALGGIAIGVRLTSAPLSLALAFAILFRPIFTPGVRRFAALGYVGGMLAGLLPLAALVAIAPRQAIFGNFEYALLNTAYRTAHGYSHAMSMLGKLKFIITDVFFQPGATVLLILFIAAALQWIRAPRQCGDDERWRVGVAILMVLMTLIGAWAPTPSYLPYYAAPIVFLTLTVILAAHRLDQLWFRAIVGAAIIALPLGVAQNARNFWALRSINHWVPLRVHTVGQEIARLSKGRRVLTFAPIYPLEGGAPMLPTFACGPFSARVAPMLDRAKRAKLKLLDPSDIANAPTNDIGLVLITGEGEIELPLIAFAKQRGIPIAHLNRNGELNPIISGKQQE